MLITPSPSNIRLNRSSSYSSKLHAALSKKVKNGSEAARHAPFIWRLKSGGKWLYALIWSWLFGVQVRSAFLFVSWPTSPWKLFKKHHVISKTCSCQRGIIQPERFFSQTDAHKHNSHPTCDDKAAHSAILWSWSANTDVFVTSSLCATFSVLPFCFALPFGDSTGRLIKMNNSLLEKCFLWLRLKWLTVLLHAKHFFYLSGSRPANRKHEDRRRFSKLKLLGGGRGTFT